MTYRIDLFALFIFLGIVQAAFLSFFFFSKENRKLQSNVFHGILLISMAACLLEIFLMYTGYIVECLYLVDFSEPASFLIGPALYLMIISQVKGKPLGRKYLWHFAFPILYFLLFLPFLLSSEDCKYNSYIYSYHPNLPLRDISGGDPRWFAITDYHTELTLFSLALYGALSLIEVMKAFKNKHESFLHPANPILKNFRMGIIQIISILILIVVVKIFNQNDTGDHLFAAYIAVTIYLTSFSVINRSGFFKQTSLNEQQKYKSSTLTQEQLQSTLQKLKQVMEMEKPFLRPNFSLPDLAHKLNVSVHTLSQVINDGLGKTFFEMTAEYRIQEAKILLKNQLNIKVEEIAEQVGYNSKSSFNTAFKKITGKTPSAYRN
jgi:AraC-like DNA-binding protein